MSETTTRKLSLVAEIGTDGWSRNAERTATVGLLRGRGATIPAAVADLSEKVTRSLGESRRPAYVLGPKDSGEMAVIFFDQVWCYDLIDSYGYAVTVSGPLSLDDAMASARRYMAQRHAGRLGYHDDATFELLAAYLNDSDAVEALANDFAFQRAYVAGQAAGAPDPHYWAFEHRAEYRPVITDDRTSLRGV